MISTEMLRVGDMQMHVATQGTGTPVVLLHGFLEFWYAWHRQMTALEKAGFRAIAPDQRGYNLTDKPEGVASYRVLELVDDVIRLIDRLGYDKVHLVGHDWGGVIAWNVAARHPDRIERLVIINGSHPHRLERQLKTWSQKLKSWYMYFFQLPGIPERLVRSEGFMRSSMQRQAQVASAFSDDDMARYLDAIRRPGAATGSVNWYRAAFRFPGGRLPKVLAPTLVLWGEQDQAMKVELLDGLEEEAECIEIVRFPKGSHWLQHEFPDEVNRLIVGFLTRASGVTTTSVVRA